MTNLGVIGLCTRRRDGALLMARHGYARHDAPWAFPGGGIEPGELPEDALLREWREELGIVPSITGLIAVAHRALATDAHVLYIYQVTCDTTDLHVDGVEVVGTGWITPGRLAVLKKHRKLFSPRDEFLAQYLLKRGSASPIHPAPYLAPADAREGVQRTALYIAGYQPGES